MTKTTLEDVRGMFTRYVAALAKAGVDVTGYYLEEGDATSAWAVTSIVNDKGGRSGGAGTGDYGYLGNTKREAYRALYVMAAVLEDVAYNARKGA